MFYRNKNKISIIFLSEADINKQWAILLEQVAATFYEVQLKLQLKNNLKFTTSHLCTFLSLLGSCFNSTEREIYLTH